MQVDPRSERVEDLKRNIASAIQPSPRHPALESDPETASDNLF